MSNPEQYLKKLMDKQNSKERKSQRIKLKNDIEIGVRQNIDEGFTLEETKISICNKAIRSGFAGSFIAVMIYWAEKEYERYTKEIE